MKLSLNFVINVLLTLGIVSIGFLSPLKDIMHPAGIVALCVGYSVLVMALSHYWGSLKTTVVGECLSITLKIIFFGLRVSLLTFVALVLMLLPRRMIDTEPLMMKVLAKMQEGCVVRTTSGQMDFFILFRHPVSGRIGLSGLKKNIANYFVVTMGKLREAIPSVSSST